MDSYKRLLSKVEDYIENNLDRRISLKELSDHVCLSEFHFHRIFKEMTSEALSQFITRIKMERSAIFLKVNSNITITEIAYRYGYCDTSSYCRAFKKHFKCTPKEFRNSKKIQSWSKFTMID